VSEVANYYDAMQIVAITAPLAVYYTTNPTLIHAVLDGASSKLVVPSWESERHPDIAIYLTRPKGKKDRTLWRRWLPELVVEVVSESSRDRDYTEKREEYWSLGIKEYWIVNAKLKQVLQLRRGKSDWIEKTLAAEDAIETKQLPGFKLSCAVIFDAAEAEPE
jgi:Uma2 family endonuclease